MAENTAIEWADHTFNPWWGCTKVSPACDNCYAEELDKRFGGAHWGPHADRRRTKDWSGPRKWNRKAGESGMRYRVFCASMADVFDNHKTILPEWRADLWKLIRETPHLDWMLLTKRPQNIKKMLPDDWGAGYANVWLGTTVENQEEADRRINPLLLVPAHVHFLSMEPLLGPVDLSELMTFCAFHDNSCDQHCPLRRKLDWIICGGESGSKARPMHPDWARSLRDQCKEAGVPFFFKQWGEWHADALCYTDAWTKECPPPDMKIGKKKSGRTLDGKVHDEYPVRGDI